MDTNKEPKPKKAIDWEAIEQDYRAGVKTIRAISREHQISDTAIHLHAKEAGWERDHTTQVQSAARAKLLALQKPLHPQRTQSEIIEDGASQQVAVVLNQRKDIAQLNRIKLILSKRLEAHLNGEAVTGAFIGEKETPGDLLVKLARTTAQLIPLERQAFNIDGARDGGSTDGDTPVFDALVAEIRGRVKRRAETEIGDDGEECSR